MNVLSFLLRASKGVVALSILAGIVSGAGLARGLGEERWKALREGGKLATVVEEIVPMHGTQVRSRNDRGDEADLDPAVSPRASSETGVRHGQRFLLGHPPSD
jgi:hypothetical protein